MALKIVADAGYGSKSNYAAIIDDFEKEQKRKFKNDPTKIHNWKYNSADNYYTDHLGVKFSFKRYSIHHDKYGFEQKLKIYEADKIQETGTLIQLATPPN